MQPSEAEVLRSRVSDRPSALYAFAKRMLDVTLSVLAFILLAPLILIIALAIKLSSKGPVIFAQRLAIGRDGNRFTLYKFRTMHTDNDDSTHRDAIVGFVNGESLGEITTQRGRQKVYKLVSDPRITPVGHILRKTGLDEIPQFINVLRGEMSVVGPRPPLQYEYELYDDWARQRLSVLPGITGLYQVVARSQASFADMLALDLEYIRRRSLLLDLWIIFKTPWIMITGRGAH